MFKIVIRLDAHKSDIEPKEEHGIFLKTEK